MKLETFFEKFDQFANAPDAVAKMRKIVLNLAIQGRLVPQDHNDEPASELLARLVREMPPEKRRRQAAPLPPLSAESHQYELPEGWTWARFRDVAIIASNLVKPDDFLDFTHLAPDNIEKGNGVLLPCATVREDKVISSNHRFYPGQIVYSKIRPNLAKVVVVNFDGLCSADMYPIDALIDAFFLQCYMLSESFLAQAVKTDTRVAMPKINQMELNAIAVPVPPLNEQKRIVAKVDELMALCDRLEAQQQDLETRQAALAHASLAHFADASTSGNLNFLFHNSYDILPADLRKSILTLAVQGKLVPFDTHRKKQTVGDHIEFQNGYAFKSEWFKPSGIRLCRNANVGHGILNWRESEFVDEKVAKEFERFALSEGDIVLSLDRPLISTGLKVARIQKQDLPCLLLQRVARPVLKHNQLDPMYFLLWLNSSDFVDSIDPGRSNGVPHISTRQVQGLPFVLPDLAEQRQIVSKVGQLMAAVDALETQLAASRATAANLLSALFAELTQREKFTGPGGNV